MCKFQAKIRVDKCVDPCYNYITFQKGGRHMPIIENTASYADKEPTNIRIEKDLKEKLLKEASEKNTTMADIVNDVLRKYYSK